MRPAELVLSVVGSSPEPVEGRTAIQKIAYFSSLRTNVDLAYRPHYYGPYSPVVANLLDNLVALGYIEENSRVTAHDRIMYSYSLTQDGRKVLNEFRKREASKYASIRNIAYRCQKIAGNSINILSWAAKTYFLLSQKGQEISYEGLEKAGKRFGWNIAKDEIASGVKLLNGLGLVGKN
jgi:DNA-binding PadR family transcriptional regulator